MPGATEQDLLQISKGSKDRLDTLAWGESLAARTGYSINDLRNKAVTDRLRLASSILKSAEQLLMSPNPSYRTTVSRAYYAMYHTVRALSYFANGGDDHQEHSKLPGNIPRDFSSLIHWENKLKQARLDRNRADYDPYPKKDEKFEPIAQDLVHSARQLLPVTRQYLKTKGWKP